MILIALLASAVIVASPSAKAQDLLNRVTDKVTEIANQLKKVYIGKVKTIGTTSIIITNSDGDYTLSTNEATTYFKIKSGSRSESTFKSIKVGDELAALGTIALNNMEMTVRQIIIKTHRYNIVGVITKSENGVITIKEFSGPESKVDITTSPTLKKNVGTIFSTAKLSEFKEGSIVSVIAYTDPQSSNLSALKAVILNL